MTVVAKRGLATLHTIGALILAPVILVIAAGIAGGLWGLINSVMTVIRPGVISFAAAIVGGYVGTVASHAACEAWLPAYHRKAVFVWLALILAALLVMELFLLPFKWEQLSAYAQIIVILVVGYGLYWKEAKSQI